MKREKDEESIVRREEKERTIVRSAREWGKHGERPRVRQREGENDAARDKRARERG